jgi:hypothetical protein
MQGKYKSMLPLITYYPKAPIRCMVRAMKADKAIKQNDTKYSPAFGEANISDLFVAFKNLNSSYSMLGNVYKLPKGVNPAQADEWLAGKKEDWDV